ncbi:glycosyltransferase family 4 protein [Azotobacter chroococcum]|uniref:glycosyltransferase family 4 protein n=1 Tax=Azotobacter chroococcum TaxID=353 RepID=UPI001E5C54F4|nr:glycosyltransferase family 1 protein [Azotobacter chroococcum]
MDQKRIFGLIYVNARFLTQPITGVQRYSLEISRQLSSLLPSIKFVAPKNIIHHEIARALGVEVVGSRTGHTWEQIDLPLFLKRRGTPLLVNLANTAPLFYKKKISTLHDVAFERFPENFSWKFRSAYRLAIPKALKGSLQVLTVSEFSKKEICAIYNIPSEKVSVVPNAVSESFQRKPSSATEHYVLAVSSINRQKNFHGLIEAFGLLKQNTHKLYIAGSLNKNFADPDLVKKIESDPRIKLLGRVSDEDLVNLYSGADAFIFPSFYEGFGIPPLEAQACGCPVIVSNAASLPEICEDSVLYCSPHDTNDIAEKIKLLISKPDLAQTLKEKGYANIERYNWKTSTIKLLEAIRKFQ